jgi:hypothetical protein
MSELARFFPAIYLINLPERVDRLSASKKELARVGWEIGSGGVQIYPAQRFEERAGFPNAGARGCFHSHLNCLLQAHRDGCSAVLILEDDVVFCNHFAQMSSLILQQIRRLEWDFLYFGHEGADNAHLGTQSTEGANMNFRPWAGDLQTTSGYAVHGSVLSRLIAHLERLPRGIEGDDEFGPMPIDGAYNIFRRHNPDVRSWISYPKLIRQRPSRSDISPKAFDSIEFIRPITTALRDLKRSMGSWLSHS